MVKNLLLLLLLIVGSHLSGQSWLGAPVGSGLEPADNEAICPIPWYLGGFEASGRQAGDSAADFTIYTIDGLSFNLRSELQKGKPVLLVAGNYTCPVFRKQLASLNQVLATYGPEVNAIIYYNVEAHPTDTSPYFGYVNVTAANTAEGVLYAQPSTYGERKQIVRDMLNDPSLSIDAQVYLDDACNSLWSFYGPAPNNAYLIDTNGRIFTKHAWFDKFPDDIFCDIDSLLGITGNCQSVGSGGTFTIEMISNDTVYGPAGTTLAAELDLVNNSASEVQVLMRRTSNVMAAGWASSMCADVCFSTLTDSATILIPAGGRQSFHFYFYTSDLQADTSKASVRFRNMEQGTNVFNRNFFGITTAVTDIVGAMADYPKVYPNPAQSWLQVDNDRVVEIFNSQGEILLRGKGRIDISSLSAGLYFVRYQDASLGVGVGRVVKQ